MKVNKKVVALLILLLTIAGGFFIIRAFTNNSVPVSEEIKKPGDEVTASAQDSPTPAETEQAVSIAPAETPSETPAPSIEFIESAELKLPSLAEDLQYGQKFNLRGTVQSASSLKSIAISVTSADSAKGFDNEVTFSGDVHSYAFDDFELTSDGIALCDKVTFETLKPGEYKLNISGKAAEYSETIPIVSAEFRVVESEWLQLLSNNFRDNYSHALAFFGDKTMFLFKYKWTEGRNIDIDPAWVKKNIKAMTGLNGQKWTMHVDAIPYFEKAIDYLKNTYIRVSSDQYDSGVIQLSKLVKSYNGLYVSRYVTDKTFISHHAFGTAVDINAGFEINKNILENRALIETEVREHLIYNGIEEKNGRQYYDFTYTGNAENYYKNVPETVLNYLLYELVFYRAGFGWGYYYRHTCDAMHFTLTEFDISVHENEKTGLRKITTYISD